MATPLTLTLRPLTLLRRQPTHQLKLSLHQKRTFIPNPFSSFNPLATSTSPSTSTPQYQTLTARRTLPYASHPIYTIISDVPSYSSFLPYCQSATITRWSAPDAQFNRRWPSSARIVVGYGQLTESFDSSIFCVPGRIVESVGGGTETNLPRAEIAHHFEDGGREGGSAEAQRGLLTHLKSRWTLEPLERKGDRERTDVKLELEFAFANPLYTTLSAGAAPKVADVMIRAFEERVRQLLENDPEMARATLGDLEGSGVKR